jgi:hypothetical protein
MALTAQQATDVRRYMGFSVSGNSTSQPFREQVYSDATAYGSLSLDYRLANLAPEEEGTITNYYLKNLACREQEIQDASATLDIDTAAVWKRNSRELSDRAQLFNNLRYYSPSVRLAPS